MFFNFPFSFFFLSFSSLFLEKFTLSRQYICLNILLKFFRILYFDLYLKENILYIGYAEVADMLSIKTKLFSFLFFIIYKFFPFS